MKKAWWKWLAVALLTYTTMVGFLADVPRLHIVNETIRALYFHVPMWFGMVALFLASAIYAVKNLRNPSIKNDLYSSSLAHAGMLYGTLGMITGMVWAHYTWGTFWHWDPKQTGAAITYLVYLAYFVLRISVDNSEQRARLSAVYNIFAFAAMIPLIFIIPRLMDSMHPGSGGNPGFNMYDLDSRMRLVFYPAVAGWILTGFWFASLKIRTRQVEEHLSEIEYENN
jgi:heme exporter protein C